MVDLLNCPFCNGSLYSEPDTLYPSGCTWGDLEGCREYGTHKEHPNKCWKIVCTCGAELHADSKEEVIVKWNTRGVSHSAEEQVCVDIYKHYHVSELKGLPESVKRAWSIGQEIYLNIINNKV